MNDLADLFAPLPPFEPRSTSMSLAIWADFLVTVPALIIWSSGAYLMFQVISRNELWAALLFPIWGVAVLIVARRLHLAGRTRIAVSLGSTGLVLLLSALGSSGALT